MGKSQRYIGGLAVAGILVGCLVTKPNIVEEERDDLETQIETVEKPRTIVPPRISERKDLETQVKATEKSQIIISPRIYEKAISDIDWIFEKGYADEISRKDFFHFHILIPSNRLRLYPDLDKSKMMKDPDIMFLYHTRESSFDFTERPERNIASNFEGEPWLVRPEWYKFKITRDLIFINPNHSNHTVYPIDLGCRHILSVYFKIDQDGSYQLKDGTNLTFEPSEMNLSIQNNRQFGSGNSRRF